MVHGIEKHGHGTGGLEFAKIFSRSGTYIFVGIGQGRQHRLDAARIADIAQDVENKLSHIVVAAGKLLDQKRNRLRAESHQNLDSGVTQAGIVLGVQKFDHLAGQFPCPRHLEKKLHSLLPDTPTLISQRQADQAHVGFDAVSPHSLETLQPFFFLRGPKHPLYLFSFFH
jgi:hypothetical protein